MWYYIFYVFAFSSSNIYLYESNQEYNSKEECILSLTKDMSSYGNEPKSEYIVKGKCILRKEYLW